MRPAYYPAMLDLDGRDALLVGGGEIAAQKAGPLIAAGVRLRIVASELCGALRARVDAGEGTWAARQVEDSDVEGAAIVVCATDDRQVNRRVSEVAQRARIPVNVVDDPELCSFIVPSIVHRGLMQIAISTAGKSPALSKFMRLTIESTIGEEYALLADLAGRMRDRARAAGVGYEDRDRSAMETLPQLLALLRDGRIEEATELADARALVGSTR